MQPTKQHNRKPRTASSKDHGHQARTGKNPQAGSSKHGGKPLEGAKPAPTSTAASDAIEASGNTEKSGKTKPERMCIACRNVGQKEELCRFVLSPTGEIAVDVRSREHGRGAWIHPTIACLTTAVKRNATTRALQPSELKTQKTTDQNQASKVKPGTLSATDLVQQVKSAYLRKLSSLLSVALRTRTLAVGTDATIEALEKKSVALVLLASDAGANSREFAQSVTAHGGLPLLRTARTKQELGAVVGKEEVAIAAVLDRKIAQEVVTTIDRVAGLEG